MAERTGHPLLADGAGLRVRGARAGVTSLAAAMVLAIGGCSGAPEPEPMTSGGGGTVIPTSPTTPSPSSPTTAPPERPAAMDRTDAEGAIAAATYFIDLYSYAYATGDVAEWKAMSDPECVFCAGLTEDVQTAAADGTRFVGGELTIASSDVRPGESASVFRVDLTVSQAAFQEIDKSGAVASAGAGTESAVVTAVLVHGQQGWLVRAAKTEVNQQ